MDTTKTILLIDDSVDLVKVLALHLSARGYEVVTASTGKEGLEKLKKLEPDLIILDLIMPDISGFNVAYQLKQESRTRNIPIIVLTSMDVDQDTREQMEGFVTGVMSKSRFTKNDLLREINAIEKMR